MGGPLAAPKLHFTVGILPLLLTFLCQVTWVRLMVRRAGRSCSCEDGYTHLLFRSQPEVWMVFL